MTFRLAILLLPLLAGCPSMGYGPAGTTSCSQLSGPYGKGSTITANADDLRKGATAKGKTVIKCGDAEMTIESDVGVAPAGAPAPVR